MHNGPVSPIWDPATVSQLRHMKLDPSYPPDRAQTKDPRRRCLPRGLLKVYTEHNRQLVPSLARRCGRKD